MKNLSFLALTAAVLLLSACSKDSKSTASTATTTTATSTTGLLCPTEGYYVLNGYQQTCSAGSTISVTTGGTLRCPSAGYYVYNGYQQSCTPGYTVTINSSTTGTTGNYNTTPCAQYSQQYGVQYVLVSYNGQQVCMRYDLARQYGYINY